MTHADKFWADKLPIEWRAAFYAECELWRSEGHCIAPAQTLYYKWTARLAQEGTVTR